MNNICQLVFVSCQLSVFDAVLITVLCFRMFSIMILSVFPNGISIGGNSSWFHIF